MRRQALTAGFHFTTPAFNLSTVAKAAAVSPARCSETAVEPKQTHKQLTRRLPSWAPIPGKRRPAVLATICAAIEVAAKTGQGRCYSYLKRAGLIAGYSANANLHRKRRFRSDGIESALAVLRALVSITDVATGLICRPTGQDQRRFYGLKDIAQFTFGDRSATSQRRVRRALAVLQSLGLCYPTEQIRQRMADGSYRSEPAARKLNLQKIASITGADLLLKRDRHFAQRGRAAPAPRQPSPRRSYSSLFSRPAQVSRCPVTAPPSLLRDMLSLAF